MKKFLDTCVTATAKVEVYLDEFDDEAVVEYLRNKGYHVSKAEDAVDDLRYPQGIVEPSKYISEFCKLEAVLDMVINRLVKEYVEDKDGECDSAWNAAVSYCIGAVRALKVKTASPERPQSEPVRPVFQAFASGTVQWEEEKCEQCGKTIILNARPAAEMVTERMVEAAAQWISESPLIHEPKLPPPAWMGLARHVLQAALAAAAAEKGKT